MKAKKETKGEKENIYLVETQKYWWNEMNKWNKTNI